jgi:large subunit ribosomal protein L10
LAISRKRKEELVGQYTNWLDKSQALYLTEYAGLSMKQVDDLRSKVRDVGGEFHIVKNTLGEVAFKSAGLDLPEKFLLGSSAIVFAFRNAPETAKVLSDFARTSEFVKIKGGYWTEANFRKRSNQADCRRCRDARLLLGVISAPASKLVRTLAEPARQVAAVLKSYADKDSAPAAVQPG